MKFTIQICVLRIQPASSRFCGQRVAYSFKEYDTLLLILFRHRTSMILFALLPNEYHTFSAWRDNWLGERDVPKYGKIDIFQLSGLSSNCLFVPNNG